MRYLKTLVVTCLLSLIVASFAQDPVKLRFVSLAWQPQAIEAVKQVVDEWNTANPAIQVEYQQVDWGSINDYLITSFETKDVPDIFHYESTQILNFGQRGYLTDLTPLVSAGMKNDVVEGAWKTVTDENGEVWGIPFLWESRIVLYNKDLFAAAGIEAPTIENPWTWDDFRAAAKKLTIDANGDGEPEQWGGALGLKSPANFVVNMSLGFGGEYFYREDGKWVVRVGEKEKNFLNLLMDMFYTDKTLAPEGIGLSGPETFPGFFEGKYAMLPGMGVWARQQIVESGPDDFNWGVLPPLKAETQRQGSATQTLSIPAAAEHKEEAMQFIEFFLNSENMAALAQGDWLFPTRESSFERPEFQTSEAGWDIATESARYLDLANHQLVPQFEEWRTRVATPVFQELFANRISVDEAAQRLEQEGNRILNR